VARTTSGFRSPILLASRNRSNGKRSCQSGSRAGPRLRGDSLVRIARWLYFDACIHRSERRFDPAESVSGSRTVLLGSATLHDDRVALLPEGSGNSRKFLFSAEAASSRKGRTEWGAHIGHNNAVSDLGLTSEWFLSCILPDEIFGELNEHFMTGRAKFILGAVESDMRVKPQDARAPFNKRITWYLQPRANLSAQTGSGRLTLFRWSLVPGVGGLANPYRKGT
jgi:hypothetical protein